MSQNGVYYTDLSQYSANYKDTTLGMVQILELEFQ